MDQLAGKWVQGNDQPFPGLFFEFLADGTLSTPLASVSVASSGSCKAANGGSSIDLQEQKLDMTGTFKGLQRMEGRALHVAVAGGPGRSHPVTFGSARIYHREG